jgi:hypothetical protein
MSQDLANNFAPYAPANNVITLLRRFRERGLPEKITNQVATQSGIPEGNISRTLQALRVMDLIDEEGNRTPTFNRLGKAREDEYPALLAEVLREAYKDVFMYINNPAEASEMDIINAFRPYEPQAQRGRMISLFRGLCQEAGLIPGGKTVTPKRVRVTSTIKSPVLLRAANQTAAQQENTAQVNTYPASPTPNRLVSIAHDYGLLEALLQQLPQDKKWTKKSRDRWLKAITANVDVLIEVEDEEDLEE